MIINGKPNDACVEISTSASATSIKNDPFNTFGPAVSYRAEAEASPHIFSADTFRVGIDLSPMNIIISGSGSSKSDYPSEVLLIGFGGVAGFADSQCDDSNSPCFPEVKKQANFVYSARDDGLYEFSIPAFKVGSSASTRGYQSESVVNQNERKITSIKRESGTFAQAGFVPVTLDSNGDIHPVSCSEQGQRCLAARIIFINGVANGFAEAKTDRDGLKQFLPVEYQTLPEPTYFDKQAFAGNSWEVHLAYNSSSGIYADFIEEARRQHAGKIPPEIIKSIVLAYEGRLDHLPRDQFGELTPISKAIAEATIKKIPWGNSTSLQVPQWKISYAEALINTTNAISDALSKKDRRVLIVSHSQDNYLSNNAYSNLSNIAKQSVSQIGVATPVEMADGKNRYIKFENDRITGPLGPTPNLPNSTFPDPTNHEFKTYLKEFSSAPNLFLKIKHAWREARCPSLGTIP